MERPRDFLGSHGITQTELGEALGMTGAAVSRKLAGLRHWKLAEVRRALEFLSGRLGRLVTYEEVFGVDNGVARTATTDARRGTAVTTHRGRWSAKKPRSARARVLGRCAFMAGLRALGVRSRRCCSADRSVHWPKPRAAR